MRLKKTRSKNTSIYRHIYSFTHTHVLHLESYFRELPAIVKTDYKIVAVSPNMMSAQAELSFFRNNLLSGRGCLLRESSVISRN